MDKTQPPPLDLIRDLEKATALLVTICMGLEAERIPFPPDLADWWCGYKKAQEPKIQLIK
jgi:hypothetical protein